MFTIKTTYKGPTNTRGSRIVATMNGHRITCTYNDMLSTWHNHQEAAFAMIRYMRDKQEFGVPTGQWVGGELDTLSYVWCYVSPLHPAN